MTINNGNIYDCYEEAFVNTICNIYSDDSKILESRNGNQKEILSINFVVNDPSTYVFENEDIGRLKYDYAERFYDWMIAGSDEASTNKFLEKYPNVKNFLVKPENSNLPANFNSFYGERIVRQLPAVIKELSSNKNSRRAVLNILREDDQILFDAKENDFTEYPCCDGVTLNIRHGKLYMHVHMRSNNMGQVAKLDMYLWGRFQCELAETLNVNLGSCSWSIVSAHIFEKDFDYFYSSGILNNSHKALTSYMHKCFQYLQHKNVTISLVRHGQTIANRDRKLQGITDSRLVDDSTYCQRIQNAVDTATKVYCSNLGRAIKTASKFTDNFEKVELLNEMNWGKLDGIIDVDDDFIRYIDNFSAKMNDRYYSDSESGLQMYQRIALFVSKLLTECDSGDNVVIFGHGLPLGAMICASKDMDFCVEGKPDHEKLITL